MTYVLGMKCIDGLVLCADTMEGDGVSKRTVQKLHVIETVGQWGMCWGCSGSGDVIRKFDSSIKASLAGQKDYNKGQIEEQIEGCLKFVHDSYPDENRIYVIAGLYGKMPRDIPECSLYRGFSTSTCLAPENHSAAVGMDVTVSDFFLQNTYHPLSHVEYCRRLGITATALMKRHAEGVGGPTDMFVYHIGSRGWKPLLDREIAQLEAIIPLSELDEAVSKFWIEHHSNRNVLEELNRAEILKRSALKHQ